MYCPLLIGGSPCGKVSSGNALKSFHVLTCVSEKFPPIENIFPKTVESIPINYVAYRTRRFNSTFTRVIIVPILS